MLLAFVFGYILDLIFGDPPFIYHYVQLIGRLISSIDNKLYHPNLDSKQLKFRGCILFILVVGSSVFVCALLLYIFYKINYYLYFSFYTFIIYQSLATTSLKRESMAVYNRLKSGSLKESRKAVGRIVGRDTEQLSEKEIIKATVETIAENTNDGIIAPLLFIFFFGALGGVFLKSINTLDSMVGYKNNRYKDFGTFSAKADDISQWIPARLTALFMLTASFILSYDFKRAIKVFKRDRFKHESPNSAQSESVCAGALKIQLAGPSYYGGILKNKEYIGDNIKEIEKEDIVRTIKLMYLTSIIAFFVFILIKVVILYAIF